MSMIATKTHKVWIIPILLALAACGPKASDPTNAMAAHDGAHNSMDMTTNTVDNWTATDAYKNANSAMHKRMGITFTGDADHDFMASMIPHHEGAVDMARIVLRYGKDPETRKLAQDIIASQEKEIAQMKAWVEAHPPAKQP